MDEELVECGQYLASSVVHCSIGLLSSVKVHLARSLILHHTTKDKNKVRIFFQNPPRTLDHHAQQVSLP